MSSEWPLEELEAIADEVTVGYVGPMASEYVESGVPFLRSLNIEQFRVNQNEMKFISPDFHQRIKKSALKPGDVAIVRTGKPGTCAVVPDWLQDANCSDLVVVRCGKRIRPRFLCYWVNSVAAHHIDSHTVGAVQQHFNVGAAKKMKVAVPPLPKQDQVIAVLGSLDDRITLLRKTNATLEAIAQALFKSWFVDFAPVRAKMEGRTPEGMDEATAALFPVSFEESELGMVPNGWLFSSIGDVSNRIFSGGTPDTRKPEYWIGDIPWFSSGETRNRVVIDTEKRINQLAVQNSSTKASLPGDILIASAGQGHTRGQTSYNAITAYINQSVVAVRANRKVCEPLWLYYNLSRRYEEMRNLSDSHSSRGSLTTKLLAGMRVIVPDRKIGRAFADVVEPLMSSQVKNEYQAQTLATLRDTLLPRLISGQLRLPEAEAMLAKV